MKESTLVKLSLLCSLVGLMLLFVISLFADYEDVSISEIENSEFKDVRITGEIVSVRELDNLALMEVAEIKSVKVVVFDKRLLKHSVGDKVSVTGELMEYKGRPEIIAERIKLTPGS